MEEKAVIKNQIIEGVIWKQLLLFFFPILFGTFFQQLYNTIDTVIVGHFVGKEALACVGGSTSQIVNLTVGFFTAVASGAAVVIAQFFGANDERSVEESLHTAYAFSIIGSIIITILGIALAPSMLSWMHTPAELMNDSITYLRIYFAGTLFIFIYNIGSSILRAIGDSKTPLFYLIYCCVINIILDLVFVVFFKMGVAGVAIATIISQAISAVMVTVKLMKEKGILRLVLREIRIYPQVLKSQLRVGIPAGIQSIMYNITNVIIQAALNTFGTDTVAAWSVYGKLDALFWMMSGAFGIAITTFVGQNYGAGKTSRVLKSTRVCLAIDGTASLALTLFLIFFRGILFRIFTNDPAVIQIGSDMLFIIAPWYLTFIFIEVLSGALRGIGDVIIPTIITLVGVCALRIIWIIGALNIYPTVEAIIFSYPVTWLSTAVLFIVYYIYRVHKLKKKALCQRM